MGSKGICRLFLLLIIVYTAVNFVASEPTPNEPNHYNIIFLGSTGDLAQRYLWKGLYALFKKEYKKNKVQFTIYGVGRTKQTEGRQIVGDILLKKITCYDDKCRQIKTDFVQSVQYHALRNEADYKTLSKKITENTLSQYGLEKNQTSFERGRLFYLSIPPSALTKVVKQIHTHLLPQAGHPWVRLVMEKPFGKDKKSAQKLAGRLAEYFRDDQIYRVDHYLGKPVTRLILPFRHINRELYEPLWNRRHVERVEVVMKEAIDCKGRMGFYDDVGVVRDVMQNHLTELMLLVAMDLPLNSGNITETLEKKSQVLKSIQPVHPKGVLYGQYATYQESLGEESEGEKVPEKSSTPTFAAAVLKVDNARWQGVPFVLMSGKQLDEKSSYVRVVFKDDLFCVDSPRKSCPGKSQVVFHIASSAIQIPSLIMVSPSLPKPKTAQIWGHEPLKLDTDVFGESMEDMYKLLPSSEEEAYDAIIIGAFWGQRHLFTSQEVLMAAWNVWAQALTPTSPPRTYDINKESVSTLDFTIKGRKLRYKATNPDEGKKEGLAYDEGTFLSHPLISGSLPGLISKLSSDILRLAQESIAERGVFHLAVAGGTSPLPLFKHLVDEYQTDFPWEQTHLWQTDERCVSPDSIHSNFASLNSYLLQHVTVPYQNIHPIPVLLLDEPCDPTDHVEQIYTSQIARIIPDHRMDLILLGLGKDGHIASLFPHSESLRSTGLVTFSQSSSTSLISKRITLTFEAINKARHISVLVTGEGKRDIVSSLKGATDGDIGLDEFPVLGIKPENGSINFYMDQAILPIEETSD